MPRKVAIVIGVRHTPGFTNLDGALNGACDFGDWAENSGFEVLRFVDDDGPPVRREAIAKAIEKLVERQDVEQLFLYFAGHGLATGIDADFWFLPADNPEGYVLINVHKSLNLARQSQIPHIAVFADACRTPMTLEHMAAIDASEVIFPAIGLAEQPVDLDLFYGSRTAAPAYELPSKEDSIKAHGVFTRVLMDALKGVDLSYTNRDDETGETVLYAARLAEYLRQTVPIATSSLPVDAPQVPDCRPTSSAPRRIATLVAADTARLVVEARLPGSAGSGPASGALATGATLEVMRHDPRHTGVWVSLRRAAAPELDLRLPRHGMYRVVATLTDHSQSPEPPDPIEYLGDDRTCVVMLSPSVSATGTPVPPSLPPSPSLTTTFLVDERGQQAHAAPGDGVFFVTTEDVLTGRTATGLQELHQGQEPEPVSGLVADPGAEGWVDQIAARSGRGHFETLTGLTIVGAPILNAFTGPVDADVFEEAGDWHVRSQDYMASSSAIVVLNGERFAALALFGGFLGTATVGPLGVDHVTYLPAPHGPFDEGHDQAFVDEARRAMVLAGAAARAGRFEVSIDEARGVARTLRSYKHYNPVLGIFAAYAYHRAGDIGHIRSILDYFIAMDQPIPYDVALLAGVSPDSINHPVVPSYPMLTQGWALLGPDYEIHPALAAFRSGLLPSLWSTSSPSGGFMLADAVRFGDLP